MQPSSSEGTRTHQRLAETARVLTRPRRHSAAPGLHSFTQDHRDRRRCSGNLNFVKPQKLEANQARMSLSRARSSWKPANAEPLMVRRSSVQPHPVYLSGLHHINLRDSGPLKSRDVDWEGGGVQVWFANFKFAPDSLTESILGSAWPGFSARTHLHTGPAGRGREPRGSNPHPVTVPVTQSIRAMHCDPGRPLQQWDRQAAEPVRPGPALWIPLMRSRLPLPVELLPRFNGCQGG